MKLGPLEIGLILVIIIIIFGVGKLPQVGGAIGKGIREFRKSSRTEDEPGAGQKSTSAVKAVPEEKAPEKAPTGEKPTSGK